MKITPDSRIFLGVLPCKLDYLWGRGSLDSGASAFFGPIAFVNDFLEFTNDIFEIYP